MYLRAYATQDHAFFNALRGLGGAAQPLDCPMAVINQMFRMGGHHRYAWDFEQLRECLEQIGFVQVERSAFGDIVPEFRIDGTDDWRAHESLYVNAVKGLLRDSRRSQLT